MLNSERRSAIVQRVLDFDYKNKIQNVTINNFERFPNVNLGELFPHNTGFCGCGCGAPLSGRQTRWASEDCNTFAYIVWAIIAGRPETIGKYLTMIVGHKNCIRCNCGDKVYLDHIIPVKHGGGGLWLDNYQWLCHPCHVIKTNEDFGFKNLKHGYQIIQTQTGIIPPTQEKLF